MPKKDSSWIEQSGLYGTWTFTTQTMTDVGYYKGIAYVVMHLMPDPMQVTSCVIEGSKEGKKEKQKHEACIEADNKACSHTGAMDNAKEECVNTETSNVEWSDVTAFFQFGFRLRTGIVRKSYHEVHTSDWLGPYNMILAPIETDHERGVVESGNHTTDLYVSRYVNTPWTETQLQRPFAGSAIFNFDADILEDVVGIKAINETIYDQIEWRGKSKPKALETANVGSIREGRKEAAIRGDLYTSLRAASEAGAKIYDDDPYAKYSRTCSHGDLRPILPRLEIEKTTYQPNNDGKSSPETAFSMRLDYSMLSLPEKDIDNLYKLWPKIKSHLGPQFPLRGPYCYGKDPNRAYAIHLSYDSAEAPTSKSTWKGVKGCVHPWPCWKGDPSPPALPPSSLIPEDNHSEGSYVLDPKGLEAMIVYAFGFLLVISLVFNCQLANKLKTLRLSGGGRSRVPEQGRLQNNQSAASDGNRNIRNDSLLEDNGMDEPLLSSADDDLDRDGPTESRQGVEESKQEAAG